MTLETHPIIDALVNRGAELKCLRCGTRFDVATIGESTDTPLEEIVETWEEQGCEAIGHDHGGNTWPNYNT